MAKSRKLKPNLDQKTTKIFNLTVLQRMDPNVEEILFTSGHVTFYVFDINSSQWSCKGVQGSLFVVERSAEPRFQFIVLNRLSLENLVENLWGDFVFEVQNPYLLYQNALKEVKGIWFYDSHECEEVASLLSWILSLYPKVPPKPEVSSSKSGFEEVEAPPVPSMPIMEEPSSTATASDTAEDSSIMNLFTAALNLGDNNTNVSITEHQQHPSSTIPSLFSNAVNAPSAPSANSVPSLPLSSSLNLINRTNSSDPIANKILLSNLVRPSLFTATSSPLASASPLPSAAAPHPFSLNLQQRPYGTPLLQPFPPPSPSSSPSHNPSPTPILTRYQIREMLLKLVQEDQFIDMFYKALQGLHNS